MNARMACGLTRDEEGGELRRVREARRESVAREELTVVTQDGTDKAEHREAGETETKKKNPRKLPTTLLGTRLWGREALARPRRGTGCSTAE